MFCFLNPGKIFSTLEVLALRHENVLVSEVKRALPLLRLPRWTVLVSAPLANGSHQIQRMLNMHNSTARIPPVLSGFEFAMHFLLHAPVFLCPRAFPSGEDLLGSHAKVPAVLGFSTRDMIPISNDWKLQD